MSGLNLFAYGSEDDESDEKETQTTSEENNLPVCESSRDKKATETSQMQEDNISTSATNHDETIQVSERDTTSVSSQSIATDSEESSAKRIRSATETTPTEVKPKIIAADNANMWVKVHDPKTNKYYYWNKQTNQTTWKCPPCLQEIAKISTKQPPKAIQPTSSTQPTTTPSASTGKPNEVISSGVTFIRCKGCRGWGKDLLLPSGFCAYCSQKQGKTQVRQPAPVHSYQPSQSQLSSSGMSSRASEILGMQPKLRMYKKRPESNIPLSRREKQSWETGRVDPLSLGDSNDGPKFRKRYRD